MVRSGALTLGAIVMLDGATGARVGNRKGLFDATQSPGSLLLCGPFFQRMPQDWADLLAPFNLSQAVGHNSNGAVPVNGVVSQTASRAAPASPYLCTSSTTGNDNPQ